MEPILVIEDIDISYGGLRAVSNASLEVGTGEMVALLGPNGSGKSTLLNAVSGMVAPKKGKILYKGKDISGLTPFDVVEIGIAQVPEGKWVFPEMTVWENLMMGAYAKRARANHKSNIERLYDIFPILKERRNQFSRTLSGGEQKMLLTARALMSEPDLLLIDEISLGLAPKIMENIYEKIREIRNTGISILFVEQNVMRGLDEAERAYFMEAGKIVLAGNCKDLQGSEEVQKACLGVL